MRFRFETYILNRKEYAKIYSEITTNHAKYEGKYICVHKSYGTDNKAYRYYFENFGYANYNIYMKKEIK